MVLIRDMGMTLGEILDLEELAADCAADGVWEFFFCAPPLKVTKGVGSPINPSPSSDGHHETGRHQEHGDDAVDDRWIIDGTPSRRFRVYSRANTGEVLPDPASPLGWTLVVAARGGGGWADGHVSLGTFERWEFGDPPECCDVFGGYLYINVSVARVYGRRTPRASAQLIDDVFFGDHPDVPAYEPHRTTPARRPANGWSRRSTGCSAPSRCPSCSTTGPRSMRWSARPSLGELSDALLVAHARASCRWCAGCSTGTSS